MDISNRRHYPLGCQLKAAHLDEDSSVSKVGLGQNLLHNRLLDRARIHICGGLNRLYLRFGGIDKKA